MFLARIGPPLAIGLLAGPVMAGLAGTILPAFGYLPALGGHAFGLDAFRELAAQPGILRSAMTSLAAGLLTAAFSLLAVFAFVGTWSGTRAFAIMQHMLSPLLAVPHAAAAFGLAFLIAPSGMIARMVSPGLTGWTAPPDILIVHDPYALAMMAGLVMKEIPFLLLVTLAALPQLPARRTALFGASAGYDRLASFVYLTAPMLYRQVRLAVFAVIAFASSVVDVAVILGPTTPPPLAVRLVGWMSDPDLSMRFLASAGAVLQLGVTIAALALWLVLERAAGAVLRIMRDGGIRFRAAGPGRAASAAAVLPSAFVIIAGLGVLALWSVAGLWQFPDALPESLSLRTWTRALPQIGPPLATTLIAGLASAAIATLLAVLCLSREDELRGSRAGPTRGLWLVYLPLIVPQAAFLFGLQLLFIGIGVPAGTGAILFAHIVFVLPYVFLSLSDPWRSFDPRLDAIAAGFGKSARSRLIAIRLPMLSRAVLAAMAVGFAVSVGQYLPTVLMGAGRATTITTEAVALAAGGNRRVIGVYAFLQMMLPAAGFAIATAIPALLFRNRRAMRV